MTDEDRGLYRQFQEYVEEMGGEERVQLYTSGALTAPLPELITRWISELSRLGLSDGKALSPADIPQTADSGAVEVEASDGRTVLILLDAYHDEDGDLCAEIRVRYSRTDGAILAMLAVLEGGENNDPFDPYRERPSDCAAAIARHYRPDLEKLPEDERRRYVDGLAQWIEVVAKAARALQQYAERELVGKTGDPARDVRAAELRKKGRSSVEIGDELGISKTKADESRHENQNARKAADRGDDLLKKATQ